MIVESYIKNRDWDALSHHLASVSNAEFRRLQTVMREKVMPHLANEMFWETYLHLLMFRRQAFLPCVLAAKGLAKSGSLDFDCQEAREVAACQAIMKKSDDMSFNMASLLRSYFDLHEIKSTFSLQIEPYELSYIEQSYENFEHILKGKRPKL